MYLWSNSPGSSSESNGDATFMFFDDFEAFNSGDWTKQLVSPTLDTRNDPADSGRGDVLYYYGNGWSAFKKTTYTFTDGVIHFEFYRPTASADDEMQFCWRMSTSNFNDFYEFAIKENPAGSGTEYLKFQKFVGGRETQPIPETGVPCPDGQWHDGKIVASGDSIQFWLNGVQYFGTFTDTSHSSGYLGGRNDKGQYLNDVFVRKYASTEPGTSVGTPSSTGQQPVPELPTVILFSVGLIVLAGYALLRKRL